MSASPTIFEFLAGREWVISTFLSPRRSNREANKNPGIGQTCDWTPSLNTPRATGPLGPAPQRTDHLELAESLPHVEGHCIYTFCSGEKLHLRIHDPGLTRFWVAFELLWGVKTETQWVSSKAWSMPCSSVALASSIHQYMLNESLNIIVGSENRPINPKLSWPKK